MDHLLVLIGDSKCFFVTSCVSMDNYHHLDLGYIFTESAVVAGLVAKQLDVVWSRDDPNYF